MCTLPLLNRIARESYIDAVESLRGRRDFLVSEEVSCQMPSGTRARGEAGSPWKFTREVASIGWAVLREHPAWMPLIPLLVAVRLFVLGNAVPEMLLVHKGTRRWRAAERIGGRISRPLAPSSA